MVGRGAANGGDDGVVVRVGVVWVVDCWVVAIVLYRSPGDANVGFAEICWTGGLQFAGVVLLVGPADAVVVVGLAATDHRGVSRGLGKRYLPLVARLWSFGVSQDFGTFQGAAAPEACGGGAGDVVHLLAGG